MSCYHAKDPETGLWVFIPDCYGGLNGPSECTCGVAGSELEHANLARDQAILNARSLMRTIKRVRADLEVAQGRIRALNRKIKEMDLNSPIGDRSPR